MSWLRKVFEVNPGYEQYLLSAVFGLLFSALVDPGGSYWRRAWHIAAFAAAAPDRPSAAHRLRHRGYRVLWTLCGVGIGVIVMLLAGLLAKRQDAKAPPQPARQPA